MGFLKKIAYFIFSAGFVSGFVLLFYVGYLSLTLPVVEGIKDFNPPIPSQILSKDGEVLLETGVEDREIAKIDEIPQKIIDAFLAAEDSNFYNHKGVDYFGILRATLANIKAGRVVQGGSTITQQVAKQLYLSGERSFTRKFKDMLLALELEKKFSKDEILYLYLNQVYLGGGYYGVKAAFKGYFNKELEEATHAECALVAGLLVAPGRYSPYLNPVYAKRRQNYVLERLFANNKISQDEYELAQQEILKFRIKKSEGFKGGHFTDWVRQRIIKSVGKENFYTNGFKVVTTLDWSLQEIAEKAVLKGVKDIDKRQGFKGPIKYLETSEEIRDFIRNQREKIFVENSLYFELMPDAEKKYELEFSEDEYMQLMTYHEENHDYKGRFKVYPDNPKDLNKSIESFIKTDETYEAVITHIDDYQKAIYVSLAGIHGIIEHEDFRWARERVISEKRNYIPDVYNPSTAFKVGQVVKVKIEKRSRSAYAQFHKNFRADVKPKMKKIYSKQRFYDFSLEQESDVEGALVALNPSNGEIISMVGGADFDKSQFNRAIQSLRQPGSAFKPILYAAALEKGFQANSILIDSPESLGGVDSSLNWKPRNYDMKFLGPITFRRSLEKSRNVPTIKLANQVSVPYIHEFVKRIGIEAELAPDLSLSLGSFGMSLLNLTKTYAIFPNGGNTIKPKSIISISDRFGNVYDVDEIEFIDQEKGEEQEVNSDELVAQQEPAEDSEKLIKQPVEISNLDGEGVLKSEGASEENKDEEEINQFLADLGENYVYDKRLSYIMTNLLKGVVQNGTGRGAHYVSSFIGGKTGTTNNYVDALFVGFASNVALGVWTGFDNNQTLGWGESGAKAALPIWRTYMQAFLKKYGEYDFKVPDGIVNVRINKENGKLADGNDSNTIMEAFVVGTEPGSEKVEEIDTEDAANDGILDEDEYYSQQ